MPGHKVSASGMKNLKTSPEYSHLTIMFFRPGKVKENNQTQTKMCKEVVSANLQNLNLLVTNKWKSHGNHLKSNIKMTKCTYQVFKIKKNITFVLSIYIYIYLILYEIYVFGR